jgi:hypothetical protein
VYFSCSIVACTVGELGRSVILGCEIVVRTLDFVLMAADACAHAAVILVL